MNEAASMCDSIILHLFILHIILYKHSYIFFPAWVDAVAAEKTKNDIFVAVGRCKNVTMCYFRGNSGSEIINAKFANHGAVDK